MRYEQFNKIGFGLLGALISKIPLNSRNLLSNLLSGKITSRQIRSVGELMKLQRKDEFYHSFVSANLDADNIVMGASEEDSKNPLFESFSSNFPQDYAITDMITYLPDDILTKVDRAAMAVSLETRVPLLNHKVVEFALKLPISYKYRNGRGKWILRELLYRYVPQKLIERPKKGFSVPLGLWLREDLREWAEDLLDDISILNDGIFNGKVVKDMWTQHLKGADLSPQLWPILMVSQWLREHK